MDLHAANGPKDATHRHDKPFNELFASNDNLEGYAVDEDPYPYGDAIAVYRRDPELLKRFMLKY